MIVSHQHTFPISSYQLDFDNRTYFENVIGFLRNSTAKSQGKLYSVDDRTKWNVAPTVVNANYHRFRNSISKRQCFY